jgi:hypothetical protein
LTEILLELPVLDTVSAAAALSALGDKSAAPALIKALKDPSWVRRAQAAKALWFLGDQSATEALAELVMLPVSAEAEMDHIEGRAKVAALRAIRSKGDRRAVPALLKAVSSPCAKIRDEAIQTLKYFPDVVFERPNCAKGHWFEHGKCGVCGLIRRHHSGFTDLHLAIHKDFSHYKIRMLCENGLVNIGDEVGFTPLMKAAGPEGNLTIVKLLVQLGADINAESRRGASALSMAALHDKQDVVQYLKECGAKGGFSIRTRSSSGDSVKRY